jgi:hypothetical protein
MISAYKLGTGGKLQFHGMANFDYFNLYVPSDNSTKMGKPQSLHVIGYIQLHGILMFFAASVIGAALATMNRYMKDWYAYHQIMHSILGFLFFVLMLTGMIVMWHNVLGGFKNAFVPYSFFGVFGSIDVFIMCLVTLGGMICEVVRKNFSEYWGATQKLVRLRGGHKFGGWFVLILSQYAVGKGTYTNYDVFKKDLSTGQALVAANAAGLILYFLIMETRHRFILAKEDAFTKVSKTMTIA